MKSTKRTTCLFKVLPAVALLLAAGCGGGGSTAGSTDPAGTGGGSSTTGGAANGSNTAADPASANVMPLSVDGGLCSSQTSSYYLNKPCVSVTICTPGTTTCQTVNDVLLDTGSFGLRLFKQALPNLSLPNVQAGSGNLASCVQFADGTSLWGPVSMADVQLGGEPAVTIPIQVVDAAFGSRPTGCSLADASPAIAGFTGILGAGVFNEDCGPGCAVVSLNNIYYSCGSGGTCTGTAVPLANQVQNPVSHLPVDNNGLLVQLPTVPVGGTSSISGSVIFGIGTRANNAAAASVFPTDLNGNISTTFNGLNNVGFLDTGSNGLFIPPSGSLLPICASPYASWYCPSTTRSMQATTVGANGMPSADVFFNVSNFVLLPKSSASVFSDLAGPSFYGFDWGLPFFMGRNVYFGFEGKTGLGSKGPFVAY